MGWWDMGDGPRLAVDRGSSDCVLTAYQADLGDWFVLLNHGGKNFVVGKGKTRDDALKAAGEWFGDLKIAALSKLGETDGGS